MKLYQPFKDLEFDLKLCFLCGNKLSDNQESLSVFPDWFLQKFELKEKHFRLLNESVKLYKDLRIPCCSQCNYTFIKPLESLIEEGFKGGYQTMKILNSYKVFLWVSRIMYGIVFQEIQLALEDHSRERSLSSSSDPEPLGFSPSLILKFSNLHLLLQAIRIPMDIEDFEPYSYFIFPILASAEEQPFEYRDDMATLIFSLSALDFGFIICLQDLGLNGFYHTSLLKKWNNIKLTFKQFQEFRARFFYSAYLFNPIPKFLVIPPVINQNHFTISAIPFSEYGLNKLFRPWNNNTYAQVLEAFWKSLGITKNEILEDENTPMSVL